LASEIQNLTEFRRMWDGIGSGENGPNIDIGVASNLA
jgi:hypothetical protein